MEGPVTDPPSLAVTKLRAPPRSSRVVDRPRLADRLDASIEAAGAVVLVSAPAGSGKSTALAGWLALRDDLGSAWLQIDSNDNDPVRFWGGFLAALAVVQPAIDAEVLPALRAPGVAFEIGPLPILINALHRMDSLVIVLDDYHLVTSAEVHGAIQALIDALPGHVTLVISTRVDPPLRLGRSRVRGQLSELRANELSFDVDEAVAFFPERRLDRAQIEALCQRTEGWGAGLALAAASLSRSTDTDAFVADFAGSNRLVVDYLATEYWDGLADEDRRIVLATSVLEQLCGPLVESVAGIQHGSVWLEELARSNQLLIPLDERRRWYRYHHLLRDLLRDELARTDPDQVGNLHGRATEWLTANGHNEGAIRSALAASDLQTAAALIAREGHFAIQNGHHTMLQGWLDQLGPDILANDVGCSALQVWVLVISGRFDQMGPWLDTTRRLFEQSRPEDRSNFVADLIDAAAVLAGLADGDVAAALAAGERLTSRTSLDGLTIMTADIVGDSYLWAGRFEEARPLLLRAADNGPVEGWHLTTCTALRDLAILALEEGDLGQARHHATTALDHAETNHLGEYHQIAAAHSVLGVTTFAESPVSARWNAERAVELARRSNRSIQLAYTLAARAHVHLLDDRTETAVIDLAEARSVLDRCPDPGLVLTIVARREAQAGAGGGPLPRSPAVGLVDELTPRELTVLRLLPSRLNVTEIATELFVSSNTVKGHVKAIYRKLGVNERALAVQRARELRLL